MQFDKLKNNNSKSLPKKVKIGYLTYSIVQHEKFILPEELEDETEPTEKSNDLQLEKMGLLGNCSLLDSTINIYKHQVKEELANTVLHEILHAICWAQAMQLSNNIEEKVVLNFANGLCTFIRDNPKFVDWLKDTLKS